MTLTPIAHYQGDFTEKFGIPRQSGLHDTVGQIIFTEEFANPDSLRYLEEYSHIWLIWGFSQQKREAFSPTVRPPRLGGNKRVGIFASRSPNRPNPLGLSAVQLLDIVQDSGKGLILHVSGADLMHQTPIYDIKPYLPYADSLAQASAGIFEAPPAMVLQVKIAEEMLVKIPPEKQAVLLKALSYDPRPSYQNDPKRLYHMQFAGFEVTFRVEDTVLYVLEVAEEI